MISVYGSTATPAPLCEQRRRGRRKGGEVDEEEEEEEEVEGVYARS